MSTMIGMDIAQVLRLSDQIRAQATQLWNLSSAVDRLVTDADRHWRGPDVEQFKTNWTAQYKRSAGQIATELTALADTAKKNAVAQRLTSERLEEAGGGAGHVGGGGGGGSVGSWPEPGKGLFNLIKDSALLGAAKTGKKVLGLPGNAGSALKWLDKLLVLKGGGYELTSVSGIKGFATGATEFDGLAKALKSLDTGKIAQEWSLLSRARASGFISPQGEKLVASMGNAVATGGKLESLTPTLSKLGALTAEGTKLGGALKMGGKALGPLGAVFSGISTISDIEQGNYGRAAYDGVMTVASIAACVPVPPVNAIGGAVAGGMALGQLVYDNWDSISNIAGDAMDKAGDVIEDADDWLAEHNPFHW